jgi:hypothetical protein
MLLVVSWSHTSCLVELSTFRDLTLVDSGWFESHPDPVKKDERSTNTCNHLVWSTNPCNHLVWSDDEHVLSQSLVPLCTTAFNSCTRCHNSTTLWRILKFLARWFESLILTNINKDQRSTNPCNHLVWSDDEHVVILRVFFHFAQLVSTLASDVTTQPLFPGEQFCMV